jgi:hypothetical protein
MHSSHEALLPSKIFTIESWSCFWAHNVVDCSSKYDLMYASLDATYLDHNALIGIGEENGWAYARKHNPLSN